MTKYRYQKRGFTQKKLLRIVGVFLFLFGILIGSYTFFPLLSWQLYVAPYENALASPIPKNGILTPSLLQSLVNNSAFSATFNSGDAKTWFPKVSLSNNSPKVPFFLLSIPKLGIQNAVVSTADYDIDKHLINYGGTAIPGDFGNAVIIGHSTLPQLFDPKNYKTTFARAYELKVKDAFSVMVNSVEYFYKIENIRVVDPDDTSAFAQWYDNSYVTIITCTPPGTIWKRLIIKAALQKI